MNRIRTLIPWALALCAAISLAGAAESGGDILRRALDLSAAIQDYSADVVVVMDLPNLQVPRRTAQVYYKRPNKVAIKSRGIVMIPKRALMPGNLGTEITKDTQVSLVGRSTVNGHPLIALKVIPAARGAHQDRLLVWVRGDRYTVERMEVYSGPTKELAVEWNYQLIGGRYWMPKQIAARIFNWHGEGEAKRQGTVSVTFSNVRVNTGLSDELFKEKR